jgi:hypothetical protein
MTLKLGFAAKQSLTDRIPPRSIITNRQRFLWIFHLG